MALAMTAAEHDIRSDFPVLSQLMNGRPLAYLDSASSAQKPSAVLCAMDDLYKSTYSNIHRGLYSFSQVTTQKYEAARKTVATLIGAHEREIVFTRNATEAINLVAQSWGRAFLKAGDEIILSGMEHHANIVPWQLLRDQIGVVLKVIPVLDDGVLDIEAYKTLLSRKTRLVGVTHVSNATGVVNNCSLINSLAKDFNPEIKVLFDGSQGVVHRAVSIAALGCDFYVFTGHKLYGPTGVGVLWGREDVLNLMPPYQGGGDMIETVSFEKTTYKPAPARFEAGTPAIAEVIGLGAAIGYIRSQDWQAVMDREASLYAYMRREVGKIDGLQFYGDVEDKAGILSFTATWGHPSDIAMILDRCGVAVRTGHHCCQPLMARFGVDATVRTSLGIYSNHDDVDALVDGLRKAHSLLS